MRHIKTTLAYTASKCNNIADVLVFAAQLSTGTLIPWSIIGAAYSLLFHVLITAVLTLLTLIIEIAIIESIAWLINGHQTPTNPLNSFTAKSIHTTYGMAIAITTDVDAVS